MKKIILFIMFMIILSSSCFAKNAHYVYLGESKNVESYVNIDTYDIKDNIINCIIITKDNNSGIIAKSDIMINTYTHLFTLTHVDYTTPNGERVSGDTEIKYKHYDDESPISFAVKVLQKRSEV